MVDNEETKEPDFFDKAEKALREAMGNGELLMKWIVVAEVFDKDGDKALWFGTSDDAAIWDIQGMLKFVQKKVDTRVEMVTWAQHQIDDDDDE